METKVHDLKEPRREKGWLSPVMLIMWMACLYFLSLGPVLRYTPQTALTLTCGGYTWRGTGFPTWVTTAYGPVMRIVGPPASWTCRKYDPVSIYKAYLNWCSNGRP